MKNKKISKLDYERLESFATAVNDVQYSMSLLNHHLEVVKRTGDVDSLISFNETFERFIKDTIDCYVNSLIEDLNE